MVKTFFHILSECYLHIHHCDANPSKYHENPCEIVETILKKIQTIFDYLSLILTLHLASIIFDILAKMYEKLAFSWHVFS